MKNDRDDQDWKLIELKPGDVPEDKMTHKFPVDEARVDRPAGSS